MKLLFTIIFLLYSGLLIAQKQGRARIDSIHTDFLLKELTVAKEDTNKVKLLDDIAHTYNIIDPLKSAKYGAEALALAEKLGYKKGMTDANRILGSNCMTLSDFPNALEYLQAALKLTEELHYEEDTIKLKLLDDLSYAYNPIDPAKGIIYGKQALALAEKLEFKKGIADANGKLGVNYMSLSEYPKALEYHLTALKLNEELHDKKRIAGNLGNIGNIYISLENYPKALEYYFKALKIFEEMGSEKNIALTLGNIANVYSNQNDFPNALEYSFKALKINEKLGRKMGIGANLSTIGEVYTAEGNYATGLEYYFRSLRIFEESDDKHSIAVNLGNIGECYLTIAKDTQNVKQGNLIPPGKTAKLNKAIDYSKKAIEICTEIGDLDDLQKFSQNLSDAQVLVGNYKDALESYKQAITLTDSIFGEENKVKMLNLETKREMDLKNKQIEIDQLAVAKKRNERAFFITGIGLLLLVIIFMSRNYYLQKKSNTRLAKEKNRSEDLLLNILPAEVANELKNTGTSAARNFDNVTVIFTDFVNFTKAVERMSPQELIDELHICFKTFDGIITKYNLEKIKTIGDAYLAVAGLPVADARHAENVVRAALEINSFMQQRLLQIPDKTFKVRIGIHSGNVVAGIVGVRKFAYDIWGDTVNTAARIEEDSEAGKINISQTTYELVKDKFECTYKGEIDANNKGVIKTYFVNNSILNQQ